MRNAGICAAAQQSLPRNLELILDLGPASTKLESCLCLNTKHSSERKHLKATDEWVQALESFVLYLLNILFPISQYLFSEVIII